MDEQNILGCGCVCLQQNIASENISKESIQNMLKKKSPMIITNKENDKLTYLSQIKVQ